MLRIHLRNSLRLLKLRICLMFVGKYFYVMSFDSYKKVSTIDDHQNLDAEYSFKIFHKTFSRKMSDLLMHCIFWEYDAAIS